MPPALWRCVIQHCDEAARRRLFSSCKLLSEHREGWGNQAPEETIVVEVMTEQETIDAEACIHRSVYGFTRELLGLKRGRLQKEIALEVCVGGIVLVDGDTFEQCGLEDGARLTVVKLPAAELCKYLCIGSVDDGFPPSRSVSQRVPALIHFARMCIPTKSQSSGKGASSVNIAMQLIDAGADLSATDRKGNTALHTGSKNGHVSLVCALIQAGADVMSRNMKGETPLHLVFQAYDKKGHEGWMGQAFTAVTTALVRAGASPVAEDHRGLTPYPGYGKTGLTHPMMEELYQSAQSLMLEGPEPLSAETARQWRSWRSRDYIRPRPPK